jgi:hypothetical protein
MWATRTYLTGALGSRHRDEAFGDPFELPPDRAYAETCAAIGSVMLAWRLLLATGEERFADAIERTLYNAVLPGLSLDGSAFFYTNPLQLRDRSVVTGTASARRQSWYPCACCPPNLMRTLSTFEQRLATTDDHGIQLHQLASASIATELGGAPIRLRVETAMPWQGSLLVEVEEASSAPWALEVRVPQWLESAVVRVGGEEVAFAPSNQRISIERAWSAGDRLEVELAMSPRMTLPDHRIDAVRGCAALERGPLVYCVEAADLPPDVHLDDIELAHEGTVATSGAVGLPQTFSAIEAAVRAETDARGESREWPYVDPVESNLSAPGPTMAVQAIPYFALANREAGPMRVWLPTTRGGSIGSTPAEEG